MSFDMGVMVSGSVTKDPPLLRYTDRSEVFRTKGFYGGICERTFRCNSVTKVTRFVSGLEFPGRSFDVRGPVTRDSGVPLSV